MLEPGTQIREDVAVEVLHEEYVELSGVLDELHCAVVDDDLLVLDSTVVLGDAARTLEEEAVRELHDVGLVDGGDLAAPVLLRVFEGVARDAGAGGLGHHLEALHDAGRHPVLDARVEALGVLPEDHQVDSVEGHRQPGDGPDRPHTGEQVQGLAELYVGAAEAAADGCGDGPLERHSDAPDGIQDRVRDRGPILRDDLGAGLQALPGDPYPGGLDDSQRGLGDLRANSVSGDQCHSV
jgi:hypothetical protein